MNISDFAKERDDAFTKAVMNDDWKAVRKYCKKWKVPMPEDRKAFKAGVYKAVQLCTNIPEDVKEVAFLKCIKMGFNPYIAPPKKEEKDD